MPPFHCNSLNQRSSIKIVNGLMRAVIHHKLPPNVSFFLVQCNWSMIEHTYSATTVTNVFSVGDWVGRLTHHMLVSSRYCQHTIPNTKSNVPIQPFVDFSSHYDSPYVNTSTFNGYNRKQAYRRGALFKTQRD